MSQETPRERMARWRRNDPYFLHELDDQRREARRKQNLFLQDAAERERAQKQNQATTDKSGDE